MSRIKMNHPVRWSDTLIATPREMLDAGLATIRVSECFYSRNGKGTRRAVFVDLVGTQTGVEVSGYVKSDVTISHQEQTP